jgi:hypothetical protein
VVQNLRILISTVALVLWLFVGGAGLNQIEQTAEVARTKSYCDKRAELIRPKGRGEHVSIAPLLLVVVAGQEEEERATHENRLHSPPAVAHSLSE